MIPSPSGYHLLNPIAFQEFLVHYISAKTLLGRII